MTDIENIARQFLDGEKLTILADRNFIKRETLKAKFIELLGQDIVDAQMQSNIRHSRSPKLTKDVIDTGLKELHSTYQGCRVCLQCYNDTDFIGDRCARCYDGGKVVKSTKAMATV